MSLIRTCVGILFVGLGLQLTAQDSLFAFVNVTGSPGLSLTDTNYKFQTAQNLYQQLIRARGDTRKLAPEFVMNSSRRYVAWMNPFKNQIGLEERAYDVCASMGADSLNAMAALLAHEITHYYENHDWGRSFVNSNKNLEISEKIEKMNEGLKFETQADYLGGILAISAGYNTYRVFDRFLKEVYDAYYLEEEIEGYPSLTERIEMNVNTAEQLKQTHLVFQLANMLTLLEAYSTADHYYQHILSQYQSYEIYNNAGVNACLAALQLTDQKAVPYIFPLELTMGSRLDGLNERAVSDPERKRTELLNKAESWFTSATDLAPDEAIGYINLAIVHAIRQEWPEAEFMAGKGLRLSQKNSQFKQVSDAQITLGIVLALQDQPEEARVQFILALSGNRSLAEANLARIEGPAKPPVIDAEPAQGVERIASVKLMDVLGDPQFNIATEIPEKIFCGKQVLEDSELLIHYAQDGAEYALFQQTTPAYQGTTQKGISLGAGEEEIIQAYGDPDKTFEFPDGRCLAYPERNLFFMLDDQLKLSRWIVCTTQLK